jgi:hypothetical protein
VEAFAAFGQSLGRGAFVQAQSGAEWPTDTEKAPNAVYGAVRRGKTFRSDRGLGRMWVPMLELIADRDLESGAATNVDVVPEFQVTLNRRQHVRLGMGYQVPSTIGRSVVAVPMYVLWDWFDGGLFSGWK